MKNKREDADHYKNTNDKQMLQMLQMLSLGIKPEIISLMN